ASGNLFGGFAGRALGAQNLDPPGATLQPVQAPAKETQTNSRALLLVLPLLVFESGREANLNEQRRQESDDEREHRINPDAHHADLVREQIAALLGGRSNGYGALTEEQAAHDFHGVADAVHLSLPNGGLTLFVKCFCFLPRSIQLSANAINLLNGCRQFLVNL